MIYLHRPSEKIIIVALRGKTQVQGLGSLGFCVPILLHLRDFPKIRVPYFGVLIIRILLFRVLY